MVANGKILVWFVYIACMPCHRILWYPMELALCNISEPIPGWLKMYTWLVSNSDCVLVAARRTHNAIITSLLRQNDVATSFWRNNDVIIATCVNWVSFTWCHCHRCHHTENIARTFSRTHVQCTHIHHTTPCTPLTCIGATSTISSTNLPRTIGTITLVT